MKNRFVVALLVATILEAFSFSLIRVTTTYRALEFGLSPAYLGALTAAYSMLPLVIALQAGRYIDRGHDARAGWIGGALLIVGAAGIAFSSSIVTLFVCTICLGAAQLLVAISMQTVAARIAGPGNIDRVIGNYMLCGVGGQTLAPAYIGWIGGSAAIPPTQFLFEVGLGAGILTFFGLLMLRPAAQPAAGQAKQHEPLSLLEIWRLPGMPVVFLVSVSVVTAQDIVGVYLPLIGTERGIPVSDIGILLAVRSIASMAVRALYIWFVEKLGRNLLLKISTAVAAIAYLGLAFPLPVWVMGVLIALLGGALGTTMTLAISRAVAIPGPRARGTANSMRMMGNRAALVVFPSVAGVFATVTGVGAIFFTVGVALAGVWAVVRFGGDRIKDR